MPADLISRFENRYRIVLIEGYGLSEGSCASTINPIHGPRKPDGRSAAARQEVALLGADRQPTHEGAVRSSCAAPTSCAATSTSRKRPLGSRRRMVAHRRCRLLRRDGYSFLVDRVKDMIIRGARTSIPRRSRTSSTGTPPSSRPRVGRHDNVLGEEPVAFVALCAPGSATPEELIERCRAALADTRFPGCDHPRRLPKNRSARSTSPRCAAW